MSKLLTTPELVREVAKEPSKAWRNWWRAPHDGLSTCPQGIVREHKAGDVFCGSGVYPSKEIAEAVALERQQQHPPYYELGAFPEGERPK